MLKKSIYYSCLLKFLSIIANNIRLNVSFKLNLMFIDIEIPVIYSANLNCSDNVAFEFVPTKISKSPGSATYFISML